MSLKALSKSDATKNITQVEKSLDDNDFIVSKTDTKGRIKYCNESFAKFSGFPAADLIGANHNLIRHPDMPRIAFKIAWNLIQNKKEFFGYVKNLSADGSHYWVFACITPDLNSSGNIVSFTSVRRKATQSAVDQITPIYKLLSDAERNGGVDASEKVLNNFLDEKRLSYDEFIINLQKGAKI